MIVERHKTAIRRNKLSRPVNLLLEKGILSPGTSFFDFGCGHGQDIEILSKNGYVQVGGWDPYYCSETSLQEAEVVNLGYVLNVIEKPLERTEALKKSFALAQKVLCVSVMTPNQKSYDGQEFEDGVLTTTKTFQKYFEPSEIKNYIESILHKDAIAIQPGIFLIFKNEADKLTFLERRYRNPVILEVSRLDPITREVTRVRIFKPRLEELVKESPFFSGVTTFILTHGRLPQVEESQDFKCLVEEFKSKRKLENLLIDNIDEESFLDVRAKRIEELLVFFALRRFDKGGVPKIADISIPTLNDIKSFFGSYRECLKKAEQLLFSLGNDKIMREAHQHIKIGKVLPDAIYIHPLYVSELPAPVQVKINVAQALVGDIEGCNLLKINKLKEKVSFMVYEDFEKVEHPALLYSVVVDLPKLDTKLWDFETRDNPPILHRKETFVGPDFTSYEKFVSLTQQEEAAGLLSRHDIGTKRNWEQLLKEKGLVIQNHNLNLISSEIANQT